MVDFRNAIRQAIKAKKGLTITSTAKAAGISRKHLSNYLNGGVPDFSATKLEAVCNECGLVLAIGVEG